MSSLYCPPLRLGVLGGGQLGRMLIPPALRLGISLQFLDREGAVCEDSAPIFQKGSPFSFEDVLRFSKGLDALTIEIENVNTQALNVLEEKGLAVRPSAAVIHLLQDKLKQKQFYVSRKFPTAKFVAINCKEELYHQEKLLPAVQKLQRSGYDGRGVKVLDTISDLEQAFSEPSIIEAKIPFEKEIAVIAARSHRGKLAVFPPVEMGFHPVKNILEYLFCPAEISSALQNRAKELACELAEALQVTGLLAVEMFVTGQGDLLINEAAPRPHNSGHHTIEACPVSQFEQHLRAVFDLPLGETTLKDSAATLNLLGAPQAEGPVRYEGLTEVLKIPDTYLHLYGKKETKPFRKMGHITILAESRTKVHKKLSQVRKLIRVGI